MPLEKPKRVEIVCASDCPTCRCCDEPFCTKHQMHYADCPCIGPHNAEDEGYSVEVDDNGNLYGKLIE